MYLDVPLVVISGENDPVIPFSEFKDFASRQKLDPNVYTHSTHFGGHWGFFDTYGADWVYQLIAEMQSLKTQSE